MPLARSNPFAYSGFAFLAFMAAGIGTLSMVGFTDGEPAESWRAAIETNAPWAGMGAFLFALAGLALAGFTYALDLLVSRGDGPGLSPWGRYAGYAWSAIFVASGAIASASVEMAGYQHYAEGAKTALILGFLWLTPIAALLGGALALSVGLAASRAGLPAWFRVASLAAGALTIAATPIGAAGWVGNVALGPLAAWIVIASISVPWLAQARPG